MTRDLKVRVEFTRNGIVRALACAVIFLLPMHLDSQSEMGRVTLTTYLPLQPLGAFGVLSVSGRTGGGVRQGTLLARDGTAPGPNIASVLVGNLGPGNNAPADSNNALAVVGQASLGNNVGPWQPPWQGAPVALNLYGGAGGVSGVMLGDRNLADWTGTYWSMHADTWGITQNESTLWTWNNSAGLPGAGGRTFGIGLNPVNGQGQLRMCTWNINGCPGGAVPLYTAQFWNGSFNDTWYWPWGAGVNGLCPGGNNPQHLMDYEDCGIGAIQFCCFVGP